MSLLAHILSRLVLLLSYLLPAGMRWRLLALPYREAHARQSAALKAPVRTQQETLTQILAANRGTEFGRAHAFDRVHDLASFRDRVPLRTYEELAPFIERHRRGESDVLVSGPLVGFAMSGGSRGRPKPFPVTANSLRVWAMSEQILARHALRLEPGVARGVCLHLMPCYAMQTSRSTLPMAPLPVLGAEAGVAGAKLTGVLPHAIFSVSDERLRYYLVLRLALGQRISVLRAASPGTLIILAEHLELMGPELVADLGAGRIAGLEALPEPLRRVLPTPRPRKRLAKRLKERLSQRGRLEPRDVWPGLSLLVCSTTGASQAAAGRLSDRFGSIGVMDPGYRAAEGVLTWAWREGDGGLPLLFGQHLEFLPADAGLAQAPLLLDSLEPGQRYRTVVTGFNGMYRYVMDDLVEVVSMRHGLPRLAMAGKVARGIRLVGGGELSEAEVSEAVTAATRAADVVLTGFTVWLGRPESVPEAAASEAQPAEKPNWLARLFRRGQRTGAQGPDRPVLTVALEPVGEVSPEAGRRLVAALDSELRRRSAPYDQERGKDQLQRPCLLLLKPKTLSRSRRRRLAEGMYGAHAPFPALSEDGWLVEHEDVVQQF